MSFCENGQRHLYSATLTSATRRQKTLVWSAHHFVCFVHYSAANSYSKQFHKHKEEKCARTHFFASSYLLLLLLSLRFHSAIFRYKFTTKSSASSSKTIFISSNILLILHPPSLANSFMIKSIRVFSSSPR